MSLSKRDFIVKISVYEQLINNISLKELGTTNVQNESHTFRWNFFYVCWSLFISKIIDPSLKKPWRSLRLDHLTAQKKYKPCINRRTNLPSAVLTTRGIVVPASSQSCGSPLLPGLQTDCQSIILIQINKIFCDQPRPRTLTVKRRNQPVKPRRFYLTWPPGKQIAWSAAACIGNSGYLASPFVVVHRQGKLIRRKARGKNGPKAKKVNQFTKGKIIAW